MDVQCLGSPASGGSCLFEISAWMALVRLSRQKIMFYRFLETSLFIAGPINRGIIVNNSFLVPHTSSANINLSITFIHLLETVESFRTILNMTPKTSYHKSPLTCLATLLFLNHSLVLSKGIYF